MSEAGAERRLAPMQLSQSTPADLPSWLWLWLPLAVVASQIVARALDTGQGFYFLAYEGELGLVELGTFVVLVPATVLALITFRSRSKLGDPWLGRWLLLFSLGCVYFAGEEISWGQHFMGWSSPEFFRVHNIQSETNIHNLGLSVDRIPKFLVAAVVLVAGLIMPVLRHTKGVVWTPKRGRRYWLLPTKTGACAAGIAMACRIAERIKTWFDLESTPFLDTNLKESHEFYLALFFALYISSLYIRLRAYRPV